MSTETSIQERISRARNEDMTVTVKQSDPQLVVEVENEDGSAHDPVYTVIPAIGHCSCSDRRYRNVVCKHMIRVAMEDGEVGSETRHLLADRMDERLSDADSLLEQAQDYKSEASAINTVLSEVSGSGLEETKRPSSSVDGGELHGVEPDPVVSDEDSSRRSLSELVSIVTDRGA